MKFITIIVIMFYGAINLFSQNTPSIETFKTHNQKSKFINTHLQPNINSVTSDVVNIKDFGAKGDGVTDDTAAIQAAVNSKASRVIIPPGNYLTTSTIILENVILEGSGVYNRSDLSVGSVFHIVDQNASAFLLKSGSKIIGCNFYYPHQVTTDKPLVYPATITMYTTTSDPAMYITVRDCTFVNSYIAIKTYSSTPNSSFFRISNNNICAISIGISHLYSLVQCQINNNDFGYLHWKDSINTKMRTLISSTAFALEIRDVDGLSFYDNNLFGMGGIHILSSASLALTRINNNMFDGSCHSIKIDNRAAFGEMLITNNIISAKDPNNHHALCTAIEMQSIKNASRGFLLINGNTFSPANGDHILLNTGKTSSYVRATINGNQFLSPGRNDPDNVHYSIYVNIPYTSIVTINDNILEDSIHKLNGKSVGVHVNVSAGIISNNIFRWNNVAIESSSLQKNTDLKISNNLMKDVNF